MQQEQSSANGDGAGHARAAGNGAVGHARADGGPTGHDGATDDGIAAAGNLIPVATR